MLPYTVQPIAGRPLLRRAQPLTYHVPVFRLNTVNPQVVEQVIDWTHTSVR
jgi:hypothetical protein